MKAPIVLFVYNRPEHTRQSIEALTANIYASESELFIYSDAPKNQQAIEGVQAVRSFIKNIQGFKAVTIIERDINWGLAKSIIDGVTNIVNQYGKVIVLEDDIVTSPYFLRFMNKALDYYGNEKNVWHISGWNYSIDLKGIEDAFFWRTMNCWGWATWKDRWQDFEKNVDKLISSFTKEEIYRFNLNGTENFWGQVEANKSSQIDTWAIFWYATIFKQNGLCLNPAISFVRNIGLDGSGIHCETTSVYSVPFLSEKDIDFNTIPIKENKTALKKVMRFCKKNNGNFFMNKLFYLPKKALKKFYICFKKCYEASK